MTLDHVRFGSGSPLLLVHGLGAGWRSWKPVVDELAARREVIAVDLPGFGETPPLTGEVSIATLTDSVAEFIHEQGLGGVATVGQSMGGRIVLELAAAESAAMRWRSIPAVSGPTASSRSSAPRCVPRSRWCGACGECYRRF